MGRNRTIRAGFFQNEILGALPPLARLLFAGLWTIADRDGRLEDRPLRIGVEVLPYDRDANVTALLDRLDVAGFIHRYAHDGSRFIQICAWSKHQHPHPRELKSVIPPCECGGECRADRERITPHDGNAKAQPEQHPGTAKAMPEQHPGMEQATPSRAGSSGSTGSSGSSGSSAHSRSLLSPALPVEPREKTDSRGARLPQAWTLPDEWAAWAMHECGFTPSRVAGIAADFADYWHAKAGADACKRDWLATWRRWCRKAGDDARAHGPPQGRAARNGVDLSALNGSALDAMARELGIAGARPGESMQAFVGRIQAARDGGGRLH